MFSPKTVNGLRSRSLALEVSRLGMALGSQACLYRDMAVLVKFSSNETGFYDVYEQKDRKRRKPYYAKFVPAGEKQQRFLPGSSSETAWEAACKLAYYEATKEQLPAVIKNDRPRKTSEVRLARSTCCHPFSSHRAVCSACPQEVRQEKLEKQAKKQATLAAKLASRNVENMPVQPVYPVPTGLSNRPVVAAMPLSPARMQPMSSPPVAVPVMLAPWGL